MYERFGLTLVMNHACNLRCTYCYTGAKFHRAMSVELGRRAIDCAVNSLSAGGVLELGFFGGEPLIEAEAILALVDHARQRGSEAGVELKLNMTTNGTLHSSAARGVMTLPEMHLSLSCDGAPHVHDRHRLTIEGHGSYATVEKTIDWLQSVGKDFGVVMVVRPDNVEELPSGLEHLRRLGVRLVSPSLDLWTTWTHNDARRLRLALRQAVELWAQHLPEFDVSWFSEKAGVVTGVPIEATARCAFGAGEVAVTPAGNLYPCERLIGEDRADHPMRLPGNLYDYAADFLGITAPSSRSAPACSTCAIESMCSTTCRCSNFVRTGDITRPDGLLCLVDQDCLRETARMLREKAIPLST